MPVCVTLTDSWFNVYLSKTLLHFMEICRVAANIISERYYAIFVHMDIFNIMKDKKLLTYE